MEQNTTRFGREIKFGDIKIGQTIIFCSKMGDVWTGKVIWKEKEDGAIEDLRHKSVRFFEDEKIWLVEELRIVEVDSIRLNQKPIAIIENMNGGFLSKRAPPTYPGPSSLDRDWTQFSSMTYSFSSVTEACEYHQKYLSSICEVVILKVK